MLGPVDPEFQRAIKFDIVILTILKYIRCRDQFTSLIGRATASQHLRGLEE